MEANGVPAAGDVVGDKYRIEAVLGRGGMGTVYAARHLLTDRKVALKWMVPDARVDLMASERFLREARAMGRIDHPRVVGVIDVGQDGEATFIVMELLRGESLRAAMVRRGPFSPQEAVRVMLPALEGLAAAHRLGIVHRDLKPENLFVVPDGTGESTKVLDFGISKFQSEPAQAAAVTQSGVTMGTPSYMSPEQVRGSRDVDARTDVWAVGVILFELLTGAPPFRADSYGALLVAIATEDPPPPPESVPPALWTIIRRALDKDPEARFASVASMAEALLPFGEPGMVFHAAPARSIPPPAALTDVDEGAPALASTRLPGVAQRADQASAPEMATRPAVPAKLAPPPAGPVASAPRAIPIVVTLAGIGLVSAAALLSGVGVPHLAAEPEPTVEAAVPPSPVSAPAPVAATVEEPDVLPAPAIEALPGVPSAVATPEEPEAPRGASVRPHERPRREPETSTTAPSGETTTDRREAPVRGRTGALSREDF